MRRPHPETHLRDPWVTQRETALACDRPFRISIVRQRPPKDYVADVSILNVAPEVTLFIDWDDGSAVQQIALELGRQTTVPHVYVAAQTISPTISVTADDGNGQTVETVRITIGPEVIFDDGFETD